MTNTEARRIVKKLIHTFCRSAEESAQIGNDDLVEYNLTHALYWQSQLKDPLRLYPEEK